VPLSLAQATRYARQFLSDRVRLTALALALLAISCGGGTNLLLPGDGEPAAIDVTDGDGQSGWVGEPLNDPLVFQVTDSRGRPVEGARVVFSVAQAGPGAAVVPDTATTDADGNARAQFQLGTTIGAQVGEALVVMRQGSQQPATTFTATALSETANGMAAFSGDGQSGPAGSALGQPLVIRVTDTFGNPIAGVLITWSVEGGGSVSETSNLTDGQGQASVLRTLGPAAGPQATIATSEGLAGSPVTFAHVATAGNASLLSIVSGNDQTAVAGSELPGDLVVRLVDAQGNGVSGAAVTWVVGTGGGTVAPENTTTDEAGRTSSRWTLGPNPGENRVDAVVSGVGVVHFQAIGTSAAPSRLAILTQPSSSSLNGVRLERQPVVQVRDAGGTDIRTSGIEITAQLAGGGGELLGTRQIRTDANGQVAFTDLAIAGAQGLRTLVFTAIGYAGATSAPIDIQAIPTTTTITGDSPDPSIAGALVTVSFQVTAVGVIPIGAVTVTDGSHSCSGTLLGGTGSCQLPLTNAGQRTLRATYAASTGLLGSSDTEDHLVNSAGPANKAPKADFRSNCDGLTCAFTDASTDSDGNVVSWSWDFGDRQRSTEREPTHSFPAPGTYTVTLTVADDDGAGDQVERHVEVNAPQPPPPGQTRTTITGDSPDPSDPGVAITVSFSVTAASGSPTGAVHITDQNGGGCEGQAPAGSCSYTPSGTGKRTITATYDGSTGFAGSSDTEDHTVTEPPPNRPPHAEFDISCTDLTCTFTDRSTDEDGNIVSRLWDYGDGTTGEATSHTYAQADKYKITLTVTDDDGAVDSRTKDADVKSGPSGNQPPLAAFSFNCTDLSCSFNSGGSSDLDGTIVSRTWDFGDGTTSTDPNPSHTFTSAGNYNVKLTVTDNDGANGSVTQQVSVSAANQAPTAAFAPSCSDLSCSFNSDASSDPDGNITSWHWTFGDGNSSDEPNPSHFYTVGNTFSVTLTVTDNDGATGSEIQQVTVNAPNQAPTAAFAPSCSDLSCSFNSDASTDSDGSITGWHWDFGDGNTSNDRNPSHTYASANTYSVTLTVTDNRGASDAATSQVGVTLPNQAPLAQR
jgi:PKD repeat protein